MLFWESFSVIGYTVGLPVEGKSRKQWHSFGGIGSKLVENLNSVQISNEELIETIYVGEGGWCGIHTVLSPMNRKLSL